MSEKLIDPNDAVDFMIAHSAKYAEAEATKVYMEELRKTIKAEEMKNAEIFGNGEYKTAAMQEREAYASHATKSTYKPSDKPYRSASAFGGSS